MNTTKNVPNVKSAHRMAAILLLMAILLALAGFLIGGCATNSKLAEGGPYSGKAFLYNADKTLTTSYDTINSFLTWEMLNRPTLKTAAPNVTVTADKVRVQAPQWFNMAFMARSNYIVLLSISNSPPGMLTEASNSYSAAVSDLSLQAKTVSALRK